MTNEEMENLLCRAGEGLPGPKRCAPRAERAVRHPGKVRRMAVLAAILILCSITVGAATMEVPIPDASKYMMYVAYYPNPKKYGLKLERTYGDYKLWNERELWVVPKGSTFLEALFDSTYRVLNFEYENFLNEQDREDWGSIEIDAGSTENPYWRAYFSMDEADVPDNLHDMTVHSYGGHTLYCGEWHTEEGESLLLYIKWVDYDRGYMYALSFRGVMKDREKAMEFAQMLIDSME